MGSPDFEKILNAALLDAATELKMTQLKTQINITVLGKPKTKFVRVIIVPEEMEMEWPNAVQKQSADSQDSGT